MIPLVHGEEMCGEKKKEHLSPSSDPRFTEDREEGWRQTRSYTVETDHTRISGRRRPVDRGCTRKVGSGDTVSRRTWAMRCATEKKREDFASSNTEIRQRPQRRTTATAEEELHRRSEPGAG